LLFGKAGGIMLEFPGRLTMQGSDLSDSKKETGDKKDVNG